MTEACVWHRPRHHTKVNNQVYKPLMGVETILVSIQLRSARTAATRGLQLIKSLQLQQQLQEGTQ